MGYFARLFDGSYSLVGSLDMKQGITVNPCHARSVHPDPSKYVFTLGTPKEGYALLLSFRLISPEGFALSRQGKIRFADMFINL